MRDDDDLFDFAGIDLPEPEKTQARLRFEEFHKENPSVYEVFKSKVFQLIEIGVRRVGARLIAEQMRWEYIIITRGKGDPFKLNDHYTPFYVRMFLKDHPEHKGLFELRTALADK